MLAENELPLFERPAAATDTHKIYIQFSTEVTTPLTFL